MTETETDLSVLGESQEAKSSTGGSGGRRSQPSFTLSVGELNRVVTFLTDLWADHESNTDGNLESITFDYRAENADDVPENVREAYNLSWFETFSIEGLFNLDLDDEITYVRNEPTEEGDYDGVVDRHSPITIAKYLNGYFWSVFHDAGVIGSDKERIQLSLPKKSNYPDTTEGEENRHQKLRFTTGVRSNNWGANRHDEPPENASEDREEYGLVRSVVGDAVEVGALDDDDADAFMDDDVTPSELQERIAERRDEKIDEE